MSELEFKLAHTSDDNVGTERYDIVLDRQYSLSEFMEQVIKQNPNELGEIIWDGRSNLCKYYKGKITELSDSGTVNKDRIIDKAIAYCAWGRTDYYLKFKRKKASNNARQAQRNPE